MLNKLKRFSLYILAIAILFGSGVLLGMEAGDPAKEAIATKQAHNKQVIATTLVAMERYSVCLGGDANLLPDWAKTERISAAELDAYYRGQD
jgi:hypothetical protein